MCEWFTLASTGDTAESNMVDNVFHYSPRVLDTANGVSFNDDVALIQKSVSVLVHDGSGTYGLSGIWVQSPGLRNPLFIPK